MPYAHRREPCTCGDTDARLFFLGWRCDRCRPTEAEIRANAIALAARRDARALERAVPTRPRKETR